jgi:rSAM/selenodomain-associated transferase 2
MRLAIIIPVLEEETEIVSALAALAPLRARGVATIVVDGGSRDRTAALAAPLADRVITAARGRAAQMNAGAAAATGCDALLFLHADTRLPPQADRLVLDGLARTGRKWGRFDVRISGRHPLLRVVAALMNIRSRITGVATGDQAIFVRRDLFERLGGFPLIPLMEDVALSRALKRHGPPLCLAPLAATSGRRWEQHGVIRTIVLMWRIRLAYSLGAPPARLARLYRYAAPQS